MAPEAGGAVGGVATSKKKKKKKKKKTASTMAEKPSSPVAHSAENGHPVDGDVEEETEDGDAAGEGEDGAKKKKKKKKKKKGTGGGGAAPSCPGGAGSKVAPARGVKGFTDSYVRCERNAFFVG